LRRRARLQRARRWVVWGSALFVLYTFLGGPYGIIHYQHLRNKQAKLKAEQRELVAEMVDLEQEINRLQDDTLYIEKIAREKYGFARKGERIYRVVSH